MSWCRKCQACKMKQGKGEIKWKDVKHSENWDRLKENEHIAVGTVGKVKLKEKMSSTVKIEIN